MRLGVGEKQSQAKTGQLRPKIEIIETLMITAGDLMSDCRTDTRRIYKLLPTMMKLLDQRHLLLHLVVEIQTRW